MEKRSLHKEDLDFLIDYGLQCVDLASAATFSYEPGEYLLREGSTVDTLYVVVSGKAKVCLSVSNGKQLLLCYFVSNGIIGDIELMTGRQESFTTIQAVSRLVCIGLPLSTYAPMLRENIVFINRVGRELAEKLLQRGMNGAISILHPLEARLCAYLVQTADDGVFREKLTETAELVGTSYRHLLRCLDTLCKEGLLQKKPAGYQLVDRQELSRRAGDLYLR